MQSLSPAQEPNFILLDSATETCSISLYRGAVCLHTDVGQGIPGTHIAALPQMLEHTMELAHSLDAVPTACVLSAGPGSYTGLRIASSLAKGLCHGLNIPLIAISTLELLMGGYRKAEGGNLPANAYLIPMMKAKGGEVFLAMFDAQGHRLIDDRLMALDAESLLQLVPSQDASIYLIGDVAKEYQHLSEGANVHIADTVQIHAEHMSDIALQRWEREDFVSFAYWKPNYLKEYVATVAKNKVLSQLND